MNSNVFRVCLVAASLPLILFMMCRRKGNDGLSSLGCVPRHCRVVCLFLGFLALLVLFWLTYVVGMVFS